MGPSCSVRRQVGNGDVSLPPEGKSRHHAERPEDRHRLSDGGVILVTTMKLGTLTEDERRRHEAVLARMAQKAALLWRKLPREPPHGEDGGAAAA